MTTHLHGPGAKRPSDASALYDPARPMPSAVDMERCVLSCMMQAPDFAVAQAMEKLTTDHFDVEAHALLFDMIVRQFDAGKLVDPVSLTQLLYDRDLIGKVGGPAFVSEVYTASPNPAHVAHYAKIVREKSDCRRIITSASNAIGAVFDGEAAEGGDWKDLVSKYLREMELALSSGTHTAAKPVEDVIREYTDYFDLAGPDEIDPPVSTGINGLDRILVGGIRREYIGVGAKTGHGKTLLAMQMAGKLAAAGRAGLIIGYEMSNLQILMRDIARETRVPLNEVMRREPLTPAAIQTITRKLAEWAEFRRLAMIDDPHVTREVVAAHARHLHRRRELDFLVVDYLQLAPVKRAKDERRDEVLSDLSNFYERLRKELNCTLIVPVQLNDAGDVRESRGILHPVQCFIRIEMEENEDASTGIIEATDNGLLRVIKNRFGAWNRTCPVLREGQYQTFTDREVTHRPSSPATTSRTRNWKQRNGAQTD